VNTEKRKKQFRDYYYRNLETNRAKAKERAARKRAALVETPEERQQRLAYHRQWYQEHREEAVQKERDKRAAKKAEKEKGDLPDFSNMNDSQKLQFKMILVTLLAHEQKEHLAKRRAWKHKKYGGSERKPVAPKPPKPPRIPLTAEQKCANQAAYKRKVLQQAQSDPVKLALLRAKKNAIAKRWIENMRLNDPEKYARYRKGQTDYERKHRAKSFQRRLSCIVRNQLTNALRGRERYGSLFELMGCTLDDLKSHLEKQFDFGMSWSNFGRGRGRWGIDHIKPLAAHDLTIIDEQKKAFHFSNLCPLWHDENSRKGSLHAGRRWHHTDHVDPPCQTETNA
jgi:hypothetical protein